MGRDKEQAVIEVIIKGQAANASIKDMDKAVRALRSQLNQLPKDSQEFADKKAEFMKMNSQLKSIQNEVKGVGGVFQSISKEIKSFGILAAGYLGFDWLTGSIKGIIKSNAELSDSLADIQKTTGMTDAEAKKLNTSLGQINTRTATKELRNIAIVGGQLGIAKNDIFGFTVAVDKMNVALGDEFTGGAEEITKVMGGLRNIFSDIKTDKIDQDLLHIGNAINELASNGAATGPVVSDFANRIGGVGITLGLTSGQVLGLSATLQELNVSTERGGTAVTRILQKMTTNTADFAKVAKMPVKEFTELVNRDLYGAFVKVVEGSKQGGQSATAFAKVLDSLGVDGAGASEVFAKLGTNTELLGQKVNMATDSLKGTNSILNEFKTKNTTLAAEMERLSKGFSAVFTSSSITNGIKNVVGWFADLFDKTKKVSDTMEEERKQLNMTLISLTDTNMSHEKRIQLIEDLKSKYPEYLSNINAETVSNNELQIALEKVNNQLIGKILIQRKQEELDKASEKMADLQATRLENQEKALKNINTAIENYGYKLKNNLTLEQQALSARDYIIQQTGNYNNLLAKELGYNATNLSYKKTINEQNAIMAKLEEDKLKIAKEFGIATNENNKAQLDYTRMSVQQLNQFIKDSEDSMGNWHREEAIKSRAELERRKKLEQSTILQVDEETRKKLLEARKKYLEDLEKIEIEFKNRNLTGPEKEEKAIFDKYDKLLKAEKKNGAVYQRLIFMRETELAEFQKKQADIYLKNKLAVQKRIDDTTLPAMQKEIDANNEKYAQLIADAKQYGISATELETFRAIEEAEIREKYNQKEIKDNDAKNAALSASDKKYSEKKKATFNDYYQAVGQLVDAWNQNEKILSEARVAEVETRTQTELAANKRLLDAKVINQTQYNQKNKALEEKSRKEISAIKKKAAENDKRIAIFNALINAGLTISRAFKDYQYPASIVIAALAGASALLQVSAISSQKVPEYAVGGFSDKPAGYVNKPTYFTNSSSGRDFIAGEKGREWIAPNWMMENPVTASTIEMLETIRQRGYASGGYNSTTTVTKIIDRTAQPRSSSNSQNDLTVAINNLNTTLSKGIYSKIVYDEFVKEFNLIDTAKFSAQQK